MGKKKYSIFIGKALIYAIITAHCSTERGLLMFVKVVPNTKGRKGTYFCYLVEAYREKGTIKHRIIHNFGLLDEDQVPFLKAMYAKKKPRLVYDDETM